MSHPARPAPAGETGPPPVVVVHPIHQHAYEAAVGAGQAGLLRLFVTGLYWTGRGATDPRRWRLLPGGVAGRVERELGRRRHPALDPERVRVIARYHLPATLARRGAGRLPWLRDLQLDRWATRGFDRAAARLLARTEGVALVHAFEGGSSRTLRAARRAGLRTVLDVPSAHERFIEVEAEEAGRPAVPWAEVALERELADLLLAPSGYVAACLREAGVPADRVLRLPYGVDPELFTPATTRRPHGGFRALFVGQIGERKGVRYLLEAWRRLALPDAELLLAGPLERSGRRLLAEYHGGYRWLGALPASELRRCYRRSDAFVFPSLAEGSARVTYEAMASGLPLVVTPNSGSVARDGVDGFVVPARDVDALCERVRGLHASPDARRAMGAQGRALIERRYTWRHYHQRLAAAYQAVLAGRPARAVASP
jgi:glycosyltransferase involved in cell wall biosynthesis